MNEMADRKNTELDERLTSLADQFSSALDGMAGGPMLRSGLLRAGINEIVWSLYFDFPEDRMTLADELSELARAVSEGSIERPEKA